MQHPATNLKPAAVSWRRFSDFLHIFNSTIQSRCLDFLCSLFHAIIATAAKRKVRDPENNCSSTDQVQLKVMVGCLSTYLRTVLFEAREFLPKN
jgi:hypothetical protein